MEDKLIFEKKRTTSGQKALTKGQVLGLLNSITDIEHQALLTLAIYGGLRRSDIVAIERSNINFEEHTLVFQDHFNSFHILQRNLRKANIPTRPFHALRATCIKLHQAAGLTPEQTQRIVNDSLRVIQQHYTTPSDEEMKTVIRGVELL